MDKIYNSLHSLQKYIEHENYRGWDPYDALSSPLFKIPLFKSNKQLRFIVQQFVKRVPFNLRNLMAIPKGYNPVTLGLVLQGYSLLYAKENNHVEKEVLLKKINFLVGELEKLQSRNFSGSCWGYDFDWEARHASIAAFQPTIVATGFITNALYTCYSITKNQKAKDLLVNSSEFILNDLNRTYSSTKKNSYCFSYSPFDNQVVFNASMKGARLLSQVYAVTNNKKLIEEAKNIVDFVIEQQNEDGSWFYSIAQSGKYIDNYHTGYVLDSLDEYRIYSKDSSYDNNIKKGFQYYINNFIEDGEPKFYNNKKYPIDCTSAAQSILTLIRFGNYDTAVKVAEYMINTMQNKNGYFYFRKYKNRIVKTSFMRWSNSWMFLALAKILTEKQI